MIPTICTLKEVYEPQALVNLLVLCNKGKIDKKITNELQKYKIINGNGIIKMSYGLSNKKYSTEYGMGRMYPQGKSIFNFKKSIRNYLIKNICWDIDMINSQPTIALNIAKKYSLKCDSIEKYVNNREWMITDIINKSNNTLNNDEAKEIFITILNGGSANGYDTIYKDYSDECYRLREFVNINALKIIEIDSKNSKNNKIDKRYFNSDDSLFANVCHTIERKILMIMMETINNNNRKVSGLLHDGLYVNKLENEYVFPNHIINDMINKVYEILGYTIKLKSKPIICDDFDELLKSTTDIIINDDYATKVFIEYLNNKAIDDGYKYYIFRHERDIYIYNNDIGLWSNDEEDIKTEICKCGNVLQFHEGKKLIDYSGNCNKVKSIMERLRITQYLIDDGYYNTIYDKDKGYLLFNNGILDMKTLNLLEFTPEILFTGRINRPWTGFNDIKLMDKVYKTLYVNPFELNDKDHDRSINGELLLKLHALALAGHGSELKKFIICRGESDCGKSAIFNTLKNVFESYVTNFNANTLIYNSKTDDEIKKLGSFKVIKDARLAYGTELRNDGSDNTALDGNLIKTLSGNDVLNGRDLFEKNKDSSFRTKSLFCYSGNDVNKIYPLDSGTKTRLVVIEYKSVFKEYPDINNICERLAISNFKEWIENINTQDAIILLICKAYADTYWYDNKFNSKYKLDIDSTIKENIDEWFPKGSGDSQIKTSLLQIYTYTDNEDNTIKFSDIKKTIKEKDIIISDVLLSRALKNCGFNMKKTKSYNMYTNIKILEE